MKTRTFILGLIWFIVVKISILEIKSQCIDSSSSLFRYTLQDTIIFDTRNASNYSTCENIIRIENKNYCFYKKINETTRYRLNLYFPLDNSIRNMQLLLISLDSNDRVISSLKVFETVNVLGVYTYTFSQLINDTTLIINKWETKQPNFILAGQLLSGIIYKLTKDGIFDEMDNMHMNNSVYNYTNPELNVIRDTLSYQSRFCSFLTFFPRINLPFIIDEETISHIPVNLSLPKELVDNYDYLKTTSYSIIFKSDSINIFPIGIFSRGVDKIDCLYIVQYDAGTSKYYDLNLAIFTNEGKLEETFNLSELLFKPDESISLTKSFISNDYKILKYNKFTNSYSSYYISEYGILD